MSEFTPKSFIGLAPSHSSQEIYFDYKLLSFISAKVIVKKALTTHFLNGEILSETFCIVFKMES